MRNTIFIISILLFLFCAKNGSAEIISSKELIERASYYNNKVIEYQGEVVGDVMARGDFAWMNLNDGNNAIGIWGRRNLIEGLIKYKGGYSHKGDIIFVKGIFHRACPQHGGDLDIHLIEADKIKEGFAVPHPISLIKVVNVFVLFIVVLGLFILCQLRKKRNI